MHTTPMLALLELDLPLCTHAYAAYLSRRRKTECQLFPPHEITLRAYPSLHHVRCAPGIAKVEIFTTDACTLAPVILNFIFIVTAAGTLDLSIAVSHCVYDANAREDVS